MVLTTFCDFFPYTAASKAGLKGSFGTNISKGAIKPSVKQVLAMKTGGYRSN